MKQQRKSDPAMLNPHEWSILHDEEPVAAYRLIPALADIADAGEATLLGAMLTVFMGIDTTRYHFAIDTRYSRPHTPGAKRNVYGEKNLQDTWHVRLLEVWEPVMGYEPDGYIGVSCGREGGEAKDLLWALCMVWLEWQEYEANRDEPRTFIGGAGHPPSRETGDADA